MTVRIDRDLVAGPPGPAPGILGSTEPALAQVGPASSRPFLLEGEQVAVTGVEIRGEHTVWLGRHAVVSNLTTDAGPCSNVVVAPSTLRRELLGPGGSRLEATVVAPALPLVAVQWRVPAGAPTQEGFQISFTVFPHVRDLRYRLDGGSLRAVPDEEGVPTAVVTLHPEPAEWQAVEGPDGGLGVRATVVADGPVTMLVAAGDQQAVTRAAAAGAHMASHEIRASTDPDPANMETLRVDTGVADLDHGVAWATLRTRGGLVRNTVADEEHAFWCGLGALAVGDGTAALHAVDRLTASTRTHVGWVLGGSAPVPALATLLAARYTLLTGDAAAARRRLLALPRDALARHHQESDRAAWELWALALETLADALRHAADEDDIRRLRGTAGLHPSGSGAGTGGPVRLPMVGDAPPAAGAASTLQALLDGSGGRNAQTEDVATALGSWRRLAAGHVVAGYQEWRSLLGQGLTAGAIPRGAWDTPSSPPGAAPEAARLLCGLAHGLLGLRPDAPSGRIHVAPALPGHLTAFTAHGIRVGEARFTLRARHDGPLHTFSLKPTWGRVPPLVVLEPAIPASAVQAVRMDGQPADLDASTEGDLIRVRVQVPLDAPRTLEIETAG